MFFKRLEILLFVAFLLVSSALAQEATVVGGDTFVSGASAELDTPAGRDALLTGFSIDINQRIEKDLAATGFDVNVNAPIGSDAYLAGFTIDVNQPVAEDLTATGANITINSTARVDGNARLAGAAVKVSGPVQGSLVASAGTLTLNAIVSGDAHFVVGDLSFGEAAKINGKLTYYATKQLVIPASVIDPSRVTYHQLVSKEGTEMAQAALRESVPTFWKTMTGAAVAFTFSVAFMIALAAVLMSFMPERLERLRREAGRAPVAVMSFGALGLSMLFGLIPVSAMTLFGIPLIPIALLGLVLMWILGYLIGTYAITTRVLEAFHGVTASFGKKLLALVLGFAVLALLNFIPILGWLINLGVVFLGLGAIVIRATRAVLPAEMEAITEKANAQV